MPQLDKLSFATQYFWLTIFFFVLYFLANNFFINLVFKSLKLRSIIYKIWYFFIYKFDYINYETKLRSLNLNTFSSSYYTLYSNIIPTVFLSKVINSFKDITKEQPQQINSSDFLENLDKIEIDEI